MRCASVVPLLLAVVALSGCGQSNELVTLDRVGSPDAPNTLSFQMNAGYTPQAAVPEAAAGFKKAFADWARRHPEWRLSLTVIPDSQGPAEQARLLERARVGTAPDCASVDSFSLPLFIEQKALVPLDRYFKRRAHVSNGRRAHPRAAARARRRAASTATPATASTGSSAASTSTATRSSSSRPRHEELAAFMACAHAKFTGDVGVCLATSGPGAIHLLNGLYDAKLDHQPVVAIVGQQARMSLGAQLPAGGRPRLAVQGRRGRVRPDRDGARRRSPTWSTARSGSRARRARSPA